MRRMARRSKKKGEPDARFQGIAQRLLAARIAQPGDLDQTDFAKRAGIAQNTYNQYEQAHRRPSLDNAIKLCRTYNLTLDWIYLDEAGGLSAAVWRDIIRKSPQLARE